VRPDCPDPALLNAAASGRLDAAKTARWQEHLNSCPACAAAVAEIQLLHSGLAEFGRAERSAVPVALASRIEAGLARPRFGARLPIGLAASLRQASALFEPAVAGSAIAAVAGLALGTWMALETPSPSTEALATEPYAVSTLVDSDASGIGGDYLQEDAAGSEEVQPDVAPQDSQGVQR